MSLSVVIDNDRIVGNNEVSSQEYDDSKGIHEYENFC